MTFEMRTIASKPPLPNLIYPHFTAFKQFVAGKHEKGENILQFQ
jgi:hypothetical protein